MKQDRFVAREEELARLAALVDRAVAGEASVVFVTGEAGSGKSTLLSELIARSRERHPDLGVGIGVCDAQTGAGDPYLPFREVLADLTGGRTEGGDAEAVGEATQLARFVRASARALVEQAPDLVDILVPGGAVLTRLGAKAVERFDWARRLAEITRGRTRSGRVNLDLDQSHIFEQYSALVRAIAKEHPLLLVLDDLHWTDPASAGLLFHLARRLAGDRVLLLGAYRAVDVALGRRGERHPLEPVVNELQRYYGDIFLRLGDEPEQGRRFVDALVASEVPGAGDDFREELFAHTGGQPLFTLELLRHLRERGGLERADGRWRVSDAIDWSVLPARVDGLIAERAGRLEPALRELLTVAAVEGQDFTAEVVAKVVSREPRDVVRSLSGDIEKRHRLVRARGIERVNGRRLAGYSFAHSLFHGYFYGTLDEVERVYLHESVGAALEDAFAGHTDAVALRLARHWLEAQRPAAALPYLIIAGDRARDACANEDASDRYTEAEAVLEQAAAELDDDERRMYAARMLEGRGDLEERAGHHDTASPLYDRAIALLDACSSATSIVRARVLRRSAKPLEHQRRHEEAAQRLEEAERALGDRPGHDDREWYGEWLSISVARVWVAYWRGQIDVMRAAIAAARPVIEEHGTAAQRAGFHYSRALLGMRADRYVISDETLAAARASFEASRQGGQLSEVGIAEFGLGFCHMWRRELDEAERFLRQAVETARRAGDRTLEARPLIYLSVTMRRRGDVGAAEHWAVLAEAAARDAQMDEYVGTAAAQRAWVAWRRGDADAAVREAEAALELWGRIPYLYPLRVLGALPLMAVWTERGDVESAAELAVSLIPQPMARLPEPLNGAVVAVAEARDRGDAEPLRSALADTIQAARMVGYL